MRRVVPLLAVAGLAGSAVAAGPDAASAERGGKAVRSMPLTPPGWSLSAYDNVWRQWGVAEKPADHDRAVRERYGLLPADDQRWPVGLVKAKGLFGEGMSVTCALCHTGAVAGQTHIGLGNANLDFQALSDDLTAATGLKFDLPFRFGYARGTIDAVSPARFLMLFRDAELNLRAEPLDGGPFPRDVLSRPPAWWQLKKKKTRDWTGAIDARSTRADLLTLLHPFHPADRVKGHEPTFRDIHAFVLGVRPPAYPFPIDRPAATRSRAVFADHCAKCHGTHGADWTYPNKVVPLAEIGTDPVLAESISDREVALLNATWIAREAGPDGRPYRFRPARGYQAPPLDGVWATAPYFHNASVPTLYHVLNSAARPKAFTRSYRATEADYDPVRVGVRFTAVDQPQAGRRDVYDTTRRGHSNAGHTYGDDLTEAERADLIEYLKTL